MTIFLKVCVTDIHILNVYAQNDRWIISYHYYIIICLAAILYFKKYLSQ